MSFHDKYIAEKIEENWDSFPYKLDYIMYVVFCNNSSPSDIRLKNENGLYVIQYIKDSGKKSEDNIDYAKYAIDEEELFSYLNSKIPTPDYGLDFTYETQIFNKQGSFRCNAIQNYLSLRFLDSSSAILNLFPSMLNKTTQPSEKPCQSFNNKLDNYSLYIDLNEKIPDKTTAEKKNKI